MKRDNSMSAALLVTMLRTALSHVEPGYPYYGVPETIRLTIRYLLEGHVQPQRTPRRKAKP